MKHLLLSAAATLILSDYYFFRRQGDVRLCCQKACVGFMALYKSIGYEY